MENVGHVGLAYGLGAASGYAFAIRTLVQVAKERVSELKEELKILKQRVHELEEGRFHLALNTPDRSNESI